MISVTERAVQELGAMLVANATEEEQVLRLAGENEGFTLGLDCEREGDEVVRGEAGTILVIDSLLAQALDGSTIDTTDTPQGTRLTISREE